MDNKELVLKALEHIDPESLLYQEWLNVGFALKHEGFDYSVWEDWSKTDPRYVSDECRRKWDTFHGSSSPITGATIVKYAKDHGFKGYSYSGDGALEWNDVIYYDGLDYSNTEEPHKNMTPTEQLIKYLETLFDKDDFVGYVSGDVWINPDGKWAPGKGYYDRTAGQLIASLKKHPGDLGATIGDWKEECGAWIRFNALDGKGIRNENVTSFKYALVESDAMSIADQDNLYQKLELPIAALIHSGNKSLHAIVKIDASSYDEYRKRVDYLYDFLEKNGCAIDKQNRNPSRLSRMPGVSRCGAEQTLLATNIGRAGWDDWMDFVEGVNDELPKLVRLSDYKTLPPLPEELIKGVLRCGHKMLLSGSSKAGKSFLLMELCIALAEGTSWLGFECRKSKVLYVNLEIDPASCINRFAAIYKGLNIPMKHAEDIVIWNLRGHAVPLDKLVPKLVRRISKQSFNAVIIDPIYKVITGDENNASEMGAFCNQFDKICNETGCATIYCHHHSKGAQGFKKAIDRASGSGVFARDPDAQLDIIQLETDENFLNTYADKTSSTAWRLEGNLREFPSFKPVDFWFEYPVHTLDCGGDLKKLYSEGDPKNNLKKSGKRNQSAESRKDEFDEAFAIEEVGGSASVEDLMEYMGVSERTVRERVREFKDEYRYSQNRVYKL